MFFMVYSSFIQNYHVWLGILTMRDKLKMQESQVQNDALFQDRFVSDNPKNFMMAFETTNTKQYLEFKMF